MARRRLWLAQIVDALGQANATSMATLEVAEWV